MSLDACRTLLDLARSKLDTEAVVARVGPSDPGWYDYRAAMLRLHAEGAARSRAL